MDRIVISILDDNKTVDKIKVLKKNVKIDFFKVTGEDYMIFVSKEVGEFLNKHL